jgi:hypothetical protein
MTGCTACWSARRVVADASRETPLQRLSVVRTCLNPSNAAMRKSGVAAQSTVDGGYGVLLYASW